MDPRTDLDMLVKRKISIESLFFSHLAHMLIGKLTEVAMPSLVNACGYSN
jgi:hypothetical protein